MLWGAFLFVRLAYRLIRWAHFRSPSVLFRSWFLRVFLRLVPIPSRCSSVSLFLVSSFFLTCTGWSSLLVTSFSFSRCWTHEFEPFCCAPELRGACPAGSFSQCVRLSYKFCTFSLAHCVEVCMLPFLHNSFQSSLERLLLESCLHTWHWHRYDGLCTGRICGWSVPPLCWRFSAFFGGLRPPLRHQRIQVHSSLSCPLRPLGHVAPEK